MIGYYNVTIKPTITASEQHDGVFAQDDLLFNWTKFYVPRKVGRLIGCNVNVRGTDGVFQQFPFDAYFSKSDDFSLGTINDAVAIQTNNDLLGALSVSSTSYMDGLNTMEVANIATSARLTLQPVPEPIGSGTSTTGNHILYIGGVAQGDFNFSTAVVTSRIVDVSGLSAAQLVNADIQGTDPRIVFAPGDIIHAEDDVVVGEILSMADANTITFKTDGSTQKHAGGVTLFSNAANFAAWQVQNGVGAAGDLASGDELYNIHPITLTLSFSYN